MDIEYIITLIILAILLLGIFAVIFKMLSIFAPKITKTKKEKTQEETANHVKDTWSCKSCGASNSNCDECKFCGSAYSQSKKDEERPRNPAEGFSKEVEDIFTQVFKNFPK